MREKRPLGSSTVDNEQGTSTLDSQKARDDPGEIDEKMTIDEQVDDTSWQMLAETRPRRSSAAYTTTVQKLGEAVVNRSIQADTVEGILHNLFQEDTEGHWYERELQSARQRKTLIRQKTSSAGTGTQQVEAPTRRGGLASVRL